MSYRPDDVVRFGVFEFDPATGELRKSGRLVRLQNQPRRVLRRLLSRPGQLITRDELRRELWPNDTFVDFDNGLNVAIRKIREALGDVRGSPRFVETERALGYRFIAPLAAKPLEPDASSSASAAASAETVVAEQPVRRPGRPLAVAAIMLAIVTGTSTWFWQRRDSTPSVRARDTAVRSGAAYERYLMGRSRLRSVTEEGALSAIAEFEAAGRLDPQYALAHAALGTAAAQMRVRFASRETHGVWDKRARDEAGRALALDPDLAEAHVALAAIHRFQEYDWDTVIAESRRALALDPRLDSPHLYLAVAYFHLGLLQEAQAEVEAARELNPAGSAEASEILGAIALFDGRTNEAVGHLSHAHDLTESRIVTYLLGWALYYQGDRRRSEELLTSMVDDTGPVPGNARASLAAILASTGSKSQARALAARTTEDAELIHHGAYGLATAHAQLGEPEVALRWLAQAAATGFPCYPWYARDPLLDPIRDDPRFTDFMERLRLSWEAARAKYVP